MRMYEQTAWKYPAYIITYVHVETYNMQTTLLHTYPQPVHRYSRMYNEHTYSKLLTYGNSETQQILSTHVDDRHIDDRHI